MNAILIHLSIVTGLATWSVLLWLNWQWLNQGGFKRLFTGLASVHLFRYVGLIALVPSHLDGTQFGMSQSYLAQVAWGDFIAVWLGLAAIVAVQREWRYAMWLVVAFAIEGTLDTLNAGPQFALKIHDQNLVGAMGWLILTIYVPALVVTETVLAAKLVQMAWSTVATFGRSPTTKSIVSQSTTGQPA
jgi:hypothetical protein